MNFLLLPSIFIFLTFYSAIGPNTCDGYRILGVFPVPVRSHFMMFEAMMKGLARKGHQVDVASTFPQKKPYANYTDVIVFPVTTRTLVNSVTYEALGSWMGNVIDYMMKELGVGACKLLGHPDMLKLIKNPPKDRPYDLVITQFMCANCFIGLGHALKVPVVGMSSAVLYPWSHRMVANPPNLAFSPNNVVNYIAPLDFWHRLHNTAVALYYDLLFQYMSRPQDDIMKKYLGNDAPGLREAERSVALVLVNSHPSLDGPKPVTPAVIEVGGLHVQDDQAELSKDLEDWMDNSADGFIYFTFGSMILIESFPQKLINVIYKSLGKIAPVRVLIKIPNPHLLPPGLPENFRTFSWAPQYKVLKHKNVKAFITHGGLMGTQEAIHCAVPLIGMPFMVDQFVNMDRYSKMKIAIKLNFVDLTEKNMDKALKEILYNPIYKNTMRDISAKFLDRPLSPMETATWWVEYVIRHGSPALRSPAIDLWWWQIELLDVYAFILLSAAFVVSMTIVLIRFIVKKWFTTRDYEMADEKKRK